MWTLALAGCLLALSLRLVGTDAACLCNGIINSEGQGECRTTYRGKQFCYVNRGQCGDERESSSGDRYWSYEACNDGSSCFSVRGDRCQFPFTWDGKTFDRCTTYKSENGAAWCATRVRGRNRDAVRGNLVDCAAPCDNAGQTGGNQEKCVFSTEDALRRPMADDNHPIPSDVQL